MHYLSLLSGTGLFVGGGTWYFLVGWLVWTLLAAYAVTYYSTLPRGTEVEVPRQDHRGFFNDAGTEVCAKISFHASNVTVFYLN